MTWPPPPRRQFPVIEVGAVWESRGHSGHPAGEPVRVVVVRPWRVTIQPLSPHGRREHGGGRRSLTRAQFYMAFRPRGGA